MKALLLYPEFSSHGFWNYKSVCRLMGARYPASPLGLITMAALLPRDWQLRLADLNTRRLTDADIDWADIVFIGGMLPQQARFLRLIDRVHSRGKRVVAGGPGPTSQPEVYESADHLVLGEAERSLPPFLEDLERAIAVDQTTTGLNFVTKRPREAILQDFLDVLRSTYSTKRYFDRCLRLGRALDVRPAFRPPWRLKMRYALGFLKTVVRLGLRPSTAHYYWRNIIRLLVTRVSSLEAVVNLMAMYLHFGPQSRFIARLMAARTASHGASGVPGRKLAVTPSTRSADPTPR